MFLENTYENVSYIPQSENVRLQRICADFNCDGKTQKHSEDRPEQIHQKSNCSCIRQYTTSGCCSHLLDSTSANAVLFH